MPILPQELFVALIFGAVLLAQFAYKQLRLKRDAVRSQAREGVPVALLEFLDGGLVEAAPPAQHPALVSPAAVQADPLSAVPLAQHPARRFARAALMPNRRAVQDAFVIAAILRPCRAQRSDQCVG